MPFPISFETISSEVWWPSYSQHLKRPPGSYRAAGWAAHSSVTLHWGLLTACQALPKQSWRFEGGVVLVRPQPKCVPSMAQPSMRDIRTLAELANGRVTHFQPWRCPSCLDSWRSQPNKGCLNKIAVFLEVFTKLDNIFLQGILRSRFWIIKAFLTFLTHY